MLQFNVCANPAAGRRLAFSLEMEYIPKVNCPDYTCTVGAIVWVNMADRQGPTPGTDNLPPVRYWHSACITHLSFFFLLTKY